MMTNNARYDQAKIVTVIGAVINALLGIVKLFGGAALHSHALVADGIHSFADLFTDTMVLLASKYGSQDADAAHPYGHKRIETATTFMLALLLILAGAGIVWDSIDEIISKQHTMPGVWTLPIAVFSILANETLFHYTRRVGLRIHSDLILANAWHHRSDAAASAVVMLGLIGSLIGWVWLDAAAAIIVGGMIIQMGLSYGWNSVKELVDTSVEPQSLAEIEQIIQSIEGVEKIHQLRTRLMGGDIFIDVHIMVSPVISVSEGHFIAQHVHLALIDQLERVKDVTVHVDPEDDETCEPSFNLPNRQELELELLEKWRTDYPSIQHWVLHYLDGSLSIDLICDQTLEKSQTLQQRIEDDLSRATLTKQLDITTIRLLSHTATLVILRTNEI